MAETTDYESFLRSQVELPVPKMYEIEIPETVLLSRYTNEVFAHFYQKLLETKPRMTTVLSSNPSFVEDRCNEALPMLRNAWYGYHQRGGAISGCHYFPDGTHTSSANVRTFFNLYTFWKYGPAQGNRIHSVDDLVEVLQEEQYRHVPEKKSPSHFIDDTILACFVYGIIQADKRIQKQKNETGIDLELDSETGLWKAGFFYSDFQGMAVRASENCVKKGSSQFEEQVRGFREICKEEDQSGVIK